MRPFLPRSLVHIAALVAIGALALPRPLGSQARLDLTDLPVNTWVRIDPRPGDVHPGPGGDVRWVYDRAHDVFILFGGDDVKNCGMGDGFAPCPSTDGYHGGYRRTTWVYSLRENRWHNVVPDTAPKGFPAGRCQPALAYDPTDRVVYMRGFVSSRNPAQQLNDGYPVGKLWRFDYPTKTWTDLAPPDPSDSDSTWSLNRHMVYDTVNRTLLAVGRGQWEGTNIFAYDFTHNRWSVRTTGGPDLFRNGPEESSTGPTVFDEKAGLLVTVLNDGTWRYSYARNRWTKSASAQQPLYLRNRRPHINGYIGFVYDTANGVSILYGAGPQANEIWVYDAGADHWTKMNPAGTPPDRWSTYYNQYYTQFAMAYSTKDNVIAVWGNDTISPYRVWIYRYAPAPR